MIFGATKWLQCCCTSYSHGRLSTSQFILFGFHTRSLSLLNSHSAHSFASVLSGVSTNSPRSISLPFPVLQNRCPETPVVKVKQILSTKTVHLKRPNTVHWWYLTMPRLLQLCLRFGWYLRPFGPDTTFGHPAITSALRCGLQFRYRRMRHLRRWGPKASWSLRSSMCAQAPHAPLLSPPCTGHSALFVIPGTDLTIFLRVLNLGQTGFS